MLVARQVRDFLQRVKCGRFPPIEKDMKMVAAHCGSLFLDPAALSQVPAACTLCVAALVSSTATVSAAQLCTSCVVQLMGSSFRCSSCHPSCC